MTLRAENGLICTGDASFDTPFIHNALILANAAIDRSKLAQRVLAKYPIDLTSLRVHDAFQTPLPGTSAADDLGLYGVSGDGEFGTAPPLVKTYDVKTVGATTLYARFRTHLPDDYEAGQTFQIRIVAGMSVLADTSATLDLEAYKIADDGTISADLCTTTPEDINNATLAAKDFTINPSGLVAGDEFDMRIAVAVNDAAGGTAVRAIITKIIRLVDAR